MNPRPKIFPLNFYRYSSLFNSYSAIANEQAMDRTSKKSFLTSTVFLQPVEASPFAHTYIPPRAMLIYRC